MKIILTLLSFIILEINFYGQEIVVYDISKNEYKTDDLNKIDSLENWSYKYIKNTQNESKNIDKPIGHLLFYRNKGIDDGISKSLYGKLWTPSIQFEVYNIKDSLNCIEKSNQTHLISSCLAPEVGGDMLIIGNYILLNSSVCLNCIRSNTEIDYCRPLINKVFNKVDFKNVKQFEEILRQFSIERTKSN